MDPEMVEPLLESLSPVMDFLEDELVSAPVFPDGDDELLESSWKQDLLGSQREEMAVLAELFGADFMETGRAVIEPENMDKLLRACSAIRLKIRETHLSEIDDAHLEQGELEELEWSEELQVAYAAYALFASLQELIVAQVSGELPESKDAAE